MGPILKPAKFGVSQTSMNHILEMYYLYTQLFILYMYMYICKLGPKILWT